jgi:molybdopterin/thiamine biosynthesis adenylyltransferase
MSAAGRFSDEQVRRYSRQILLCDVGGHGQARLLAAEVEVAVDDPAGRIAALLLAAAGVGRLALVGALDRRLAADDIGFPITADDRGLTLGEAMTAHVVLRNPDVAVSAGGDRAALRLQLEDDGDDRSLARAFERGGAAVAALVHALATGAAR